MSAPWLKFYPSDWRADPALRMCSIAARGLWMEMLCIMHEATPRGSLRINGRPVSDRQMATLAGVTDVAPLFGELEDAGVFSREEDGTIYSRRMMRDEEKAAQDKANGKQGGNPTLKPGVNPPDKAQIPEARNQKSEEKKVGAAKPRGDLDAFKAELYPILDTERIDALVAVRRKKGATFSALAGRSLAKALRSWPNINEAADEMVLRNWTAFKPDWMAKRSTGPPGKRSYADVAEDKFTRQANGSESVFGSHGDAQRISPRLIESRPDDAHLRGGIGGRYRPSDH